MVVMFYGLPGISAFFNLFNYIDIQCDYIAPLRKSNKFIMEKR